LHRNIILPSRADIILPSRADLSQGLRASAAAADLSAVLPEEVAAEVKLALQTSMGTDISEEDIGHIMEVCSQVVSLSEYREQLLVYLKTRMNALAPNLTALVGDVAGARLISHAGGLENLAKDPASAVQSLATEEAMLRALKISPETPEYASLPFVTGRSLQFSPQLLCLPIAPSCVPVLLLPVSSFTA
jgi:hypothetical protein